MIVYVLAMALGVLTAAYLHEGSHWFIGWLGDSDPYFEWRLWILPSAVHHERIETMDSEIIRASGLAPFLWVPILFLSVVGLLATLSPVFVYASVATLFAVLMGSKGDARAFNDPEKFRENALNDDMSRTPLILPDWFPVF